jgi:hypothetical protein
LSRPARKCRKLGHVVIVGKVGKVGYIGKVEKVGKNPNGPIWLHMVPNARNSLKLLNMTSNDFQLL